jgi:MFS family permease
MVSTFFSAFAFFGAIVFLPRWFQVVHGYSPTDSGLAALPLVVGLIVSSIASGQIVARTGRYKWLVVGAIVLMGISSVLFTQLTSTTPIEQVWVWMFVAGLGVGPTFAVFTIIIQNAVPFRELGVATSNLTFFRQIGGSVALAIVGTIFGTTFADDLVPQVVAAGVPQAIVDGMTQAGPGSIDVNLLTGAGVGFDLGQALLSQVPPDVVQFVAPYVDQIVNGIYGAFSLAVAQTFYIGIVAAAVAAVSAALMVEHPLRTAATAAAGPRTATAGSAAPTTD